MPMASMLETENRSSHIACYHPSTTKVSKVFDIPKLFEEILQFYLEIYPTKTNGVLQLMNKPKIEQLYIVAYPVSINQQDIVVFPATKTIWNDAYPKVIALEMRKECLALILYTKSARPKDVFVYLYRLDITKSCVVKPWLVFFSMITYLLLGYRLYLAWRSVNENPIAYLMVFVPYHQNSSLM